jgi:hypothetical protein
MSQKVWEKGAHDRPRMSFKQLMADGNEADGEGDGGYGYTSAPAYGGGGTLSLVAAATRERRPEKEKLTDLIGKKREMFLVQMALDTKRHEIQKLEERARQREDALARSEAMLEEDVRARGRAGTWWWRERMARGSCCWPVGTGKGRSFARGEATEAGSGSLRNTTQRARWRCAGCGCLVTQRVAQRVAPSVAPGVARSMATSASVWLVGSASARVV